MLSIRKSIARPSSLQEKYVYLVDVLSFVQKVRKLLVAMKLFPLVLKTLSKRSWSCFLSWACGNYSDPGGYVDQILLGMCCWPLRTPTLLRSIPWLIIDPMTVYSMANYRPHLRRFGANIIFCDPKLVTFCLCIYFIKPFN